MSFISKVFHYFGNFFLVSFIFYRIIKFLYFRCSIFKSIKILNVLFISSMDAPGTSHEGDSEVPVDLLTVEIMFGSEDFAESPFHVIQLDDDTSRGRFYSSLQINFEELLLSVIVRKVNKLENLFNKCLYERSRARIPIFISVCGIVVVDEFMPLSQLFYTVASSLMTN